MRLALLIGRRYAPYSKWLGTAFAGLPDPDGLGSGLAEAMTGARRGSRTGLPTPRRALQCAVPGLRLDTSLRPCLFGRPVGLLWEENPFKCGHPSKHLDHRKSRASRRALPSHGPTAICQIPVPRCERQLKCPAEDQVVGVRMQLFESFTGAWKLES